MNYIYPKTKNRHKKPKTFLYTEVDKLHWALNKVAYSYFPLLQSVLCLSF